jgi:hypothetical protein
MGDRRLAQHTGGGQGTAPLTASSPAGEIPVSYEKLGFTAFAGDASQNRLILKNGAHAIGLFRGPP